MGRQRIIGVFGAAEEVSEKLCVIKIECQGGALEIECWGVGVAIGGGIDLD